MEYIISNLKITFDMKGKVGTKLHDFSPKEIRLDEAPEEERKIIEDYVLSCFPSNTSKITFKRKGE